MHTVRLVEHHEVTEAIPEGDGDLTKVVKAIVLRCVASAQSWADDADLEIVPEPFNIGTHTAGVRWQVVVGSREGGAIPDPTTQGWIWSARWVHWYALLHRLAVPAPSHPVELAEGEPCPVIPLFGAAPR